jgi:sensor histidine kinase YesM
LSKNKKPHFYCCILSEILLSLYFAHYLENSLLFANLTHSLIMNYNARLFWLLNISVWLLHYIIQGTTSPIFLSLTLPYRITIIVSFLFWIMLITALYRYVHQELNFGNKSLQFTGIQILVSAIVMTILDIFCRFIINENLPIFYFLDPNHVLTDDAFGRIFSEKNNTDITTVVNQFYKNSQWFKFLAYVIWSAAYNFYHVSLNMRRSAVEKIAAENRAKDLELINLRSQLNPHFLFNALNSIHSLAMMKKDNASDAVLLLSDLMRYTLNYEKRDVVPLSEEIEVVEKYLQLEKIRFSKKLNTELNISDATLDIKVPPIIVQTLVENAIKHGLKESPNGVFIKIESFVENGFLNINIINSGQIKNSTPSVAVIKNSGIGVENTRRRLQMIYEELATFELKNLNENEVIATLILPID